MKSSTVSQRKTSTFQPGVPEKPQSFADLLAGLK